MRPVEQVLGELGEVHGLEVDALHLIDREAAAAAPADPELAACRLPAGCARASSRTRTRNVSSGCTPRRSASRIPCPGNGCSRHGAPRPGGAPPSVQPATPTSAPEFLQQSARPPHWIRQDRRSPRKNRRWSQSNSSPPSSMAMLSRAAETTNPVLARDAAVPHSAPTHQETEPQWPPASARSSPALQSFTDPDAIPSAPQRGNRRRLRSRPRASPSDRPSRPARPGA